MEEHLYETYSGEDFKQIYANKKFVKMTHGDDIQYGIRYRNGLIEDPITFNPTNKCSSGGIYFTTDDNWYRWFRLRFEFMVHIWDVEIPDDTLVYVERTKFKASKIILSNKRLIKDLPCWDNPLFCFKIVSRYIEAFQFVRNQTHELCLQVIKQNWEMLQYIKNKTPDICKIAIRQNAMALEYIDDYTEDICTEVFSKIAYAICYVNKPTQELCDLACKLNPSAHDNVERIKIIKQPEMPIELPVEQPIEFQKYHPTVIYSVQKQYMDEYEQEILKLIKELHMLNLEKSNIQKKLLDIDYEIDQKELETINEKIKLKKMRLQYINKAQHDTCHLITQYFSKAYSGIT